MTISRRDLALLLPALAAAGAQAQTAAAAKLPSKAFRFEDLPVKQNGKNASRALMNGLTHSGFAIEVHETDLAPGEAPHAPHHHVHEEMVIVVEGTIEFTVNGTPARLGPGSVAYAASNDEHGQRNVGDGIARYVVVAFGRDA
ncbi:MAG: cupin domain-containing protein [Bryobacteraceae bacterium]